MIPLMAIAVERSVPSRSDLQRVAAEVWEVLAADRVRAAEVGRQHVQPAQQPREVRDRPVIGRALRRVVPPERAEGRGQRLVGEDVLVPRNAGELL
jgi:hypothetical protein